MCKYMIWIIIEDSTILDMKGYIVYVKGYIVYLNHSC